MGTYTQGATGGNGDDPRLTPSLQDLLYRNFWHGQEVVEGNRNNALHWAAQQMHWNGFSQSSANELLLVWGESVGLSNAEVLNTIDSAYRQQMRETATGGNGFARSAYDQHEPEYASPPPPVRPPEPMEDGYQVYLETVFDARNPIAIGYAHQGGSGINRGKTESLSAWLAKGAPKHTLGSFVRINHVTQGGAADEDVLAFDHVLVDFDRNTPEVQYAALLACPFPILTIVHTGNRGLQALINVGAGRDLNLYRERRNVVYDYFKRYDFFDPGNGNPSRWCRLPGCRRQLHDVDGRPTDIVWQRLLEVRRGPKDWEEYEGKAKAEVPLLIRFYTPAEIAAYIPPAKLNLIGDYHIVLGNIAIIGGAPGDGKSRALVALALAGATGQPWFGLPVHHKFRTLIIQNENGLSRLQKELAEINEPELEDYLLISDPPSFGMSFWKPLFRDQLLKAYETFGPEAVAIDPWNSVARDDNIRNYQEAFEIIRKVFPTSDKGPAIVIAHHTHKPQKGEGALQGIGLMNLLSGSYLLFSVPRTVFVLQRASDDPDDDRVIWTCCKNNDGDKGPPSAWRRRNGLFAPDDNFDWNEYKKTRSEPDPADTVRDILAKYRGGLFRDELIKVLMDETGCVNATVRKWILKAVARRTIVFEEDTKKYRAVIGHAKV
jgi:hypothetical protein